MPLVNSLQIFASFLTVEAAVPTGPQVTFAVIYCFFFCLPSAAVAQLGFQLGVLALFHVLARLWVLASALA